MFCAEAKTWLISVLLPLLQFSWALHWSQSARMQHGLRACGKEGEAFGTLLVVAGGASGQLRGISAAVLLPEVVGTGQSRARKRCHLALPAPIPAIRAILAWRELRLTGRKLKNISHGLLRKHPCDVPQKVEKAQVRSASPHQDASSTYF